MKSVLSLMLLMLIGLFNFASAQKMEEVPNKLPEIKSVILTKIPVKKWLEMTEPEKSEFIKKKSDEILSLFGRTAGDEIDEAGIGRIRGFVDFYAKRLGSPKSDSCAKPFQNDLTSILRRGMQSAADIQKGFSGNNLPVQVGLYTAMIETEFCPCLQAPTGALGMFQFTFATAQIYGLKAIKGATPQNPDERCKPDLAAKGAAKYLRKMIDEDFGKDSTGTLLAIAAYNAGEGTTKKRLEGVRLLMKKEKIGFWQMATYLEKNQTALTADKSGENGYLTQFYQENIKYVPKFFAAAIVGENPQTFGVNMQPLSKSAMK